MAKDLIITDLLGRVCLMREPSGQYETEHTVTVEILALYRVPNYIQTIVMDEKGYLYKKNLLDLKIKKPNKLKFEE